MYKVNKNINQGREVNKSEIKGIHYLKYSLNLSIVLLLELYLSLVIKKNE